MTLKINDKAYWSNFYATHTEIPKTPSMFAQYLISQKYNVSNQTILELGCGNGRDSMYFSKNNLNVTAIDQCENTTSILNKLPNVRSFSADFTNLKDEQFDVNFDIIYSRFTMHSIDDDGEIRTLDWISNNLKSGGLFCIEARTLKDPLCGKGEDKGNNIWFYNNHHRRFLDANNFKNKLKTLGFDLLFFEEKNGFAVYKDEDPIVLRCIAKKL